MNRGDDSGSGADAASTTTSVLVPATRSHLPVLANLFQLYCHDFSELLGLSVAEDGRFATPDLTPYFEETWCHPFLIRVDDRWAGFVLAQQRSRLTDDRQTWDVAEFFVMRAFRRTGIGTQAATEVFDRFPGRWEVRQLPANTAATAFWRKVLTRYTGGAVTETVHDSDGWKGPVQTFVSGSRAAG
ncbi:MAG TPA: GNAT family N-acetyltransferase [Polyangia bacterium]